jgi:putative ABC transport system ATP-binding protein
MSLVLEGVRKSYRQGESEIPVLKNLALRVEIGEVVAVIGQSGSGKTTLLSLLAGLDRPSAGTIALAGARLDQMSQDELARWRAENIGIVFQQYHLLPHLNALENVQLPLEILRREAELTRARELLTDLGVGHRTTHLPRQLSGGECQRVAIARALVARPKLLLADEPSGNLDGETGTKVMDAFFAQVRKERTTTILVTHNLELAQRCDRRLRLIDGGLVEA